ncbi:hypothetical protein O3M35_010407 [Rhynocoris fuscipes]|uniref:Reverse transcriptase n=1 Tax=Rhynocoris fuscipes TaxID=488301 RepID=A0AAW1D084_9HEMI
MEYAKEDPVPFQILIENSNKDKNGIARIHPMALGKLLSVNHPDISLNIIEIKKLGRNRLRVEMNNAISANKLLNSEILKEKGFNTHIPRYLLQRRGIIRGVDVALTEDEIKEAIVFPNRAMELLEIKRLNRKTLNVSTAEVVYTPTQSVLMVIRGQMLPNYVYIHYVRCEVNQYVQNVVQCKQCLRYGHYKDQCKGAVRCSKCGEPHELSVCKSEETRCVNCGDPTHVSTNQAICPSFKKEKKIKELMAFNNISYSEAKSFVHTNSFAAIANNEVVPNVDDIGIFLLLGKTNKSSRTFANTASFMRSTKRLRTTSPPHQRPHFFINKDLLFNESVKKNVEGGQIQSNPHRTSEKNKLENSLKSNSDIIYKTVYAILNGINVSKLKSWEEIDLKSMIKERIENLNEISST